MGRTTLTKKGDLVHGSDMAGRPKDEQDPIAELSAIHEFLPLAIRLKPEMGDFSEAELTGLLALALRDPTFEAPVMTLLENEGVSSDYQKEYMQIFAEWKRASKHTDLTIDPPRKSRKPQN
jgi:hypothetical protein